MKRTKVVSSNLKSVGYDEKTETLEIEFNSGGVYQYSNVPKEIFNQLMNAPSHGKYFHSMVRDKYPTKKIR